MEACAVICRKAIIILPEANFTSPWCQPPSSRAQNRHFCALLGLGTLVFGYFEHKFEVFVLFWASEPLFSGISSTKSRFLCAFGVWNPRFRAFRAQNRGFCALIIMKWQSGRGKRPLGNGNLWLGGGIGYWWQQVWHREGSIGKWE